MAGTPSSCGGELYPNLSTPLSHLPKDIVIRFWAFQDFFVSNGHFDWKNLDTVIWIAALHHDKVIPALANQYSYCDGPSKTLPWYETGYERRWSRETSSPTANSCPTSFTATRTTPPLQCGSWSTKVRL